MAAPTPADSPPAPIDAERNLQPFFVLHRASVRNSAAKLAAKTKTRRRIDLTPSSKDAENPDEELTLDEDHQFRQLRNDACRHVWSKIESTIKDVLRDINADVFNGIHCWVQKSFDGLRSNGILDDAKGTHSYPIATDPSSKQIHAGLVFTKNMELVDDLLTFEDLGLNLRSHGYHVAHLSSFDFSTKNGVAGCIRALLRQYLMVSQDVADLSILASWYAEQGSRDKPMIVIIDDMERCCGSVLSDFILMLSEWTVRIPIILIIGVATTVDALRSILRSNALQYLSSHKFVLGSPAERMDAMVEAVLVNQCSGFTIGHKVAVFLKNYFTRNDGTLTSFVRALKIAIIQHISVEPLSFILRGLSDEDGQNLSSEEYAFLPESMFKRAFDLPSCKRNEVTEPNRENFAKALSDLRRLQKLWSSAVMCLYEAGKSHDTSLLDLYCEALDPEICHSRGSDPQLGSKIEVGRLSSDHYLPGNSNTCSFISQVIRKVRDMPEASVKQLIKTWEKYTADMTEIHVEVKELQSSLTFDEGKDLNPDVTDVYKRLKTRSKFSTGRDAKVLNKKVVSVINCMVKNYLLPVECIPFHEIICFKSVDKLQSILIGDPRRTIQVDLLEFHKFLKCSCCSKSGKNPIPSMHDTSILYMLAQEHGDLINLHDWYQSFKQAILRPKIKGKQRSKHSPSPKKRKVTEEPQNNSEASIQAKFCRAVIELQITGLLRMPSKRRPDYVQRVAFGL